MASFDKTLAFADVDVTKFKVIFFAGGHGPMFDLPNCEITNKAATDIYEKGGIVAAVCHGVAGKKAFRLKHWVSCGRLVHYSHEYIKLVHCSSTNF